jgi:hypothetical protein
MTYAVAVYNSTKDRWLEVMEWTTEPPTVEGWYWVKRHSEIDLIFFQDGTVTSSVYDNARALDYSHWLGPLPEPELPKD